MIIIFERKIKIKKNIRVTAKRSAGLYKNLVVLRARLCRRA